MSERFERCSNRIPCYVGVVKASLKKIVLNTGASKRIDTKVLSVAILLPQRYPYSGPVCPPFKKGQTGPFVMKRFTLGNRAPICSATCYSMVLFEGTKACMGRVIS